MEDGLDGDWRWNGKEEEEIEIKYELTLEYRCSLGYGARRTSRARRLGAWLRPLFASRVAGLAALDSRLEFSFSTLEAHTAQRSPPDCQSASQSARLPEPVSASVEQLLTCYLRRHDETE